MLTRLLTRKVPYTFNRFGYSYFSRRVPADLTQHYSYPRIVQGLKTRSAQTAKSRASVAAEPMSGLQSLSELLQRLENNLTYTVIGGSLTGGQSSLVPRKMESAPPPTSIDSSLRITQAVLPLASTPRGLKLKYSPI